MKAYERISNRSIVHNCGFSIDGARLCFIPVFPCFSYLFESYSQHRFDIVCCLAFGKIYYICLGEDKRKIVIWFVKFNKLIEV